jgi:hypothetical protein
MIQASDLRAHFLQKAGWSEIADEFFGPSRRIAGFFDRSAFGVQRSMSCPQ